MSMSMLDVKLRAVCLCPYYISMSVLNMDADTNVTDMVTVTVKLTDTDTDKIWMRIQT